MSRFLPDTSVYFIIDINISIHKHFTVNDIYGIIYLLQYIKLLYSKIIFIEQAIRSFLLTERKKEVIDKYFSRKYIYMYFYVARRLILLYKLAVRVQLFCSTLLGRALLHFLNYS